MQRYYKKVWQLLTEVFGFPEFILARYNSESREIEFFVSKYGSSNDGAEWSTNRVRAYLFYDLYDVKDIFPNYSKEHNLLFSWLDEWPTHKIYEELFGMPH